jgi:hypothetical protein
MREVMNGNREYKRHQNRIVTAHRAVHACMNKVANQFGDEMHNFME